MTTRFRCRPPAILLILLCASCGEDPKLVAKHEKQKAEIVRLKGELALIDEKLASLPPDVTVELAEAKKSFEQQSTEVARLESEVETLESRKRALEKEFEDYQAKYQVK